MVHINTPFLVHSDKKIFQTMTLQGKVYCELISAGPLLVGINLTSSFLNLVPKVFPRLPW